MSWKYTAGVLVLAAAVTAAPQDASGSQVSFGVNEAVRQSDGSFVIGDLLIAPGDWSLTSTPTENGSCCLGVRLVSGGMYTPLVVQPIHPDRWFTAFAVELQYNDPDAGGQNQVWGWLNATSLEGTLARESFGGHSWSPRFAIDTINLAGGLPTEQVRIEPRIQLGYLGFTYSLSPVAESVPEPGSAYLLLAGIAGLSLFGRRVVGPRVNSAP